MNPFSPFIVSLKRKILVRARAFQYLSIPFSSKGYFIMKKPKHKRLPKEIELRKLVSAQARDSFEFTPFIQRSNGLHRQKEKEAISELQVTATSSSLVKNFIEYQKRVLTVSMEDFRPKAPQAPLPPLHVSMGDSSPQGSSIPASNPPRRAINKKKQKKDQTRAELRALHASVLASAQKTYEAEKDTFRIVSRF
jgi:hypothetical protein